MDVDIKGDFDCSGDFIVVRLDVFEKLGGEFIVL